MKTTFTECHRFGEWIDYDADTVVLGEDVCLDLRLSVHVSGTGYLAVGIGTEHAANQALRSFTLTASQVAAIPLRARPTPEERQTALSETHGAARGAMPERSEDTERLAFLIACTEHHWELHGRLGKGYVMWDVSDGLVMVAQGDDAISVIDAAREKAKVEWALP